MDELKLTPRKRECRKTVSLISDIIYSLYKESKRIEGNK